MPIPYKTNYSSIEHSIVNFIQSKNRNEWLSMQTSEGYWLDVYVRKSKRVLPSTAEPRVYLKVFDIASITVERENRGKGAFKEFLRKTENIAMDFNFSAMFVENILNIDLFSYLVKREGYIAYGEDSAYKIFTPENCTCGLNL